MADEKKLPDTIEEAHEMIKELRKENAGRRVANRDVDEAFAAFTPAERSWLLDRVALLSEDPDAGALEFRNMAQAMLKEKFYDGLDLPEQAVEETEEEEDDVTKKPAAGLTLEDLQRLLDERDAKAEEKALTKEQQAAQDKLDAEVEGVLAEVEALGFPRDSLAFQMMLARGAQLANDGKPVDFKELAPAVRTAAAALGEDLPEPEEEAAPAADGEEETFPSSASLAAKGGTPTDGGADEDWVEQAKAKGASADELWSMARDRMNARLG